MPRKTTANDLALRGKHGLSPIVRVLVGGMIQKTSRGLSDTRSRPSWSTPQAIDRRAKSGFGRCRVAGAAAHAAPLCLFISTNKVFGSSRRLQSRHVGCGWTRRCQLRCLSDFLLGEFLSGTWSKALGQRGGAAQGIPISPDSLHALGVREGF